MAVDNPDNPKVKMLPFWRRSNPFVQNLLVCACLFFNPGLYLAIATLGAGGGKPSSIQMGNISNATLYGVFTFTAIGASSMLNMIGPRLTLMIAVTGYPIYTGSLWYFDATGHLWFPILGGACLGASGGCLWTTASFVANTYPEEKDKGIWRACQWVGNVTGATIGGCVALGINWNAKSAGVPHSVYIIFIILQICSVGFAAMVVSPDKLIRPDGTHLAKFKPIPLKENLKEQFALLKDYRILILIPCFIAPEMFFPLSSSMNAYTYNLRTRTLNSMLGNAIQIPATFAMGWILDSEKLGTRKRRGLIAIAVDCVIITGTYIAQTIWLSSWKFDRSVPGPNIDCTDAAYPGAVVIYLLYVMQYGIFQNVVIWTFGSLSNDPRKLGQLAGIYVGILSAGTAISFGSDATSQPYENENAGYFALTTICWPILAYVVWNHTKDTNYFTEDTVVAPVHIQETLGHSIVDAPVIEGEGYAEREVVMSSDEKSDSKV